MAIGTSLVTTPLSVALYNADGTQRRPYYLVTIDLPAYSPNAAKTLHLSTPDYTGPDGTRWDDTVLEVGQINAGGSWLTSKWNPVDLDLVISDKRVTGQGVAETFHDYMPDYEFVGATVHVQIAFENTVSVNDYRTIFYGKVVDWADMDSREVTLYCSQDRSWSVPVPPNAILKGDYPYAPMDVLGLKRPIVIGDFFLNAATIPNVVSGSEAVQAGVARAVLPALVVEQQSASGGLTTPKAILSDKDLYTDPTRLLLYEPSLEVFAYSDAAPTITGTGPTYAQVDGSYQFNVPILGVENDGSTATSWQECTRKDKAYTLTGKTSFDYTATTRVLQLLMPEVQELGTFVGASVLCWYNKSAGGASLPRFGLKHSVNGDGLADFPTAATSSVSASVPYGFTSVNVGPIATGGTDSIQAWPDIVNGKLYADVRTAGQTLEIHRIALVVKYRPYAKLVTPAVARGGTLPSFPRTGRLGGRPDLPNFRGDFSGSRPATYEYGGPLYCYARGVPDSGHASATANGTYTGTSGALIEHPVDIVHWALRELGGLASSAITTTSGDFGSFADARTDLASYKFACSLSQEQGLEEFVEDIGAQALCWFHRRTTEPGAPWVAIPWATSASRDYREASDLVDFNRAGPFVVRDSLKVGRTPLSGVANAIRVNYDYDLRTRTYGDQLYITPDGSRIYSAGAFTTDGARVTTATTSETRFGSRELTVNLSYVRDPLTASSILLSMFDWRVNPRVRVRFATFLNALDLERGHILRLGSDWDSFLTYPKPGGDGSWASKNLQVYAVRKLTQLPVQYEVLAVET